MAEEVVLAVRGISKEFPGVKALDGVDFTLRHGEIHTIMGENGAGKSTLIKCLTGVQNWDAGEVTLAGTPIHPTSPIDAQRLGISTVYQEVNLVPNLSLAENVFLGRRGGIVKWGEINREAAIAMRRLNVDVDPRSPLASLSIAVQQMVAIARALVVDAKVLVLDEPTSSLDTGEVDQLFEVLRKLKADGMGIVFVSHFLDQVYAISDRFTVLRNGKLVGEYEAAGLPRISLISKMLGRDEAEVEKMSAPEARRSAGSAEIGLAAHDLGRRRMLSPVSLEVKRGEVVGLAGLLGSGRSEVLRLLFGLAKPDSGGVTVDGNPYVPKSPRKAIRAGLGFIPEDRKVEGIVPNLSVRENIALALQAKRGWLKPLSPAKQKELAEKYVKALKIATPSIETPVSKLSGGNQQKVLLARWLAAEPTVLLLDEPTRGVDVGAKAEIEALTASLCDDGLAILFIASDLEEVTRVSNRVVVMRDRKKVGELSGEDLDVPSIMKLVAAEHTEVTA